MIAKKTTVRRTLLCSLGGLVLASVAGCYERTIRADGPGSSSKSIYQPTDTSLPWEEREEPELRQRPGGGGGGG